MRLSKVKAKNKYYYYIIKDFERNGVRTTAKVCTIGSEDKVKEMAGTADYKEWLDNFVKKYIDEHDDGKAVIIKKRADKRITPNKKYLFNVGYLFLKSIYHDLKIKDICDEIQKKYKFEFDLNEILSYLVFARVTFPSSKRATFKYCQKYLEPPTFSQDDEYRALDYLAENMDFIQESLYNNSIDVLNRDSSIIYYDCTNYYFETDEEDGFRMYGISKENRPNPLVGMGLFMDADGLPLSFHLYPGNQNEKKDMTMVEDKIVKNFKVDTSKMILCTDAGLSSDEIKKFNVKNGKGFVITQPLKQMKKKEEEQALDPNGWRIVGDLNHIYNLDELNDNEVLRDKYYYTTFYKIIMTETKSVKQDIIITFSFKFADYHKNIRNAQVERAKKKIEKGECKRRGKNQNDCARFIRKVKHDDEKEEKEEFEIDEDLVEEEAKWDGRYGLATNVCDDVEKILRVASGRWEIEESFRILKSEFKSRPVEVRKPKRIEAHFLTCFLALFLFRTLEKKLDCKYSYHQIIEKLKEMTVYEEVGYGYSPAYERDELTDNLHEVFGFNTDNEINSYKKFKNILKQIS